MALTLGALSSEGQWSYYDVIDGNSHPNKESANTFNATTDSQFDWTVTGDGTPEWRFRNTGPGVPSWGTSAYQGRYSESDVSIYTSLSGLLPNTEYMVRVYGVFPQNSTNAPLPGSRYGAEISLDGGTDWEMVDNRGGILYNWVDNSTELGAPLAGPSGDTRYYASLMATLLTDGTGLGRIDVRLPQNLSDLTLQDRFVLDGFAVAIPEPVSVVLVGLGTGLLLFFRRRIL